MSKRGIFCLIVTLGGLVMAVSYLKRKNRKMVRVDLRNGARAYIKVRSKLSAEDAAKDRVLCAAVRKATDGHLSNGNPVARYDLALKKPYWEYPDGSTRYAE